MMPATSRPTTPMNTPSLSTSPARTSGGIASTTRCRQPTAVTSSISTPDQNTRPFDPNRGPPRAREINHLTLAYASTVHAAQGRTVDTSHALLDEAAAREAAAREAAAREAAAREAAAREAAAREAAAREAAYVALSRGRDGNFAYLVAQRDPDAHQPERLEHSAAGRLAGVLGNVEARNAAEVERRIGERDGASLAWIGTQWDEVSRDSARARYTGQIGAVLDPEQVEALTAEPGWPRLVRAVRLWAADECSSGVRSGFAPPDQRGAREASRRPGAARPRAGPGAALDAAPAVLPKLCPRAGAW